MHLVTLGMLTSIDTSTRKWLQQKLDSSLRGSQEWLLQHNVEAIQLLLNKSEFL